MRARQAVTSCPAAGADAMRDTLDMAAALADWPRGLDQLLAGLDRLTAGPAGPARCGRRAAAGPKKRTRPAGEAPSVTGGEHAELRTLFEDAAAGLALGEREVIELRLRQGLAATEVAAVLGVSRSRARLLLAQAGNELEACLGVLLVGRAGRDECTELGSLLAGWDGRLTAGLRSRVHRHIERCQRCAARRAQELRPAKLRDLPPGAALSAGAAESARRAPGAPAALRAHTIALALGRAPGAAAHRTAVLARAGAFGGRGFPRPGDAAGAGLAGRRGPGPLLAWLWFCRHRRVTAAAVATVALTAAASALVSEAAPLVPAGHPQPSLSAPAPPAPPAPPARPTAAAPGAGSAAPATATARSLTASAPATGTAGSAEPGHHAGRAARHNPLPSKHRHLRSWIESNRLRGAHARQRRCRIDRGG